MHLASLKSADGAGDVEEAEGILDKAKGEGSAS